MLQVQNGSPASQALAHLGSCKSPACAIEIDQLGANGEIAVSHRFSDGTSRTQYSTNELEEVSFTFGKIVVANLAAGTDSLSDVLTTSS